MEDGSVNHTGDPTVHTELLYRSDAVELTGLNNEGGGEIFSTLRKCFFQRPVNPLYQFQGFFDFWCFPFDVGTLLKCHRNVRLQHMICKTLSLPLFLI